MSTRKKFELSPRLKLGVGRSLPHNKILKFSAIACLGLAAILAVYGGQLVFRHRSALNSSSPQVLGASTVKPKDAGDEIKFIEYKVQKGDTLFNVSQKFNINWTTLSTLNNIKSPFTLKPGQTIKVPKQ